MGLPVLWKPVVGWEGKYWVSNTGLVRGVKGVLKTHATKQGYRTVTLERGPRDNRKCKNALVHRLVATAFLPNINNFPQVNHKDEDKNNNNVDNLEWCTAKYNMNYGEGAKTRHLKIDYSTEKRKTIARENGGRTTSKVVIQLNEKGEIVAMYKSIHEAYRATKIRHIGEVANGLTNRSTAGGFGWAFSKGGAL